VAEKKPRKTPPKRAKKTWQSPRVKSGQLFESNSLACLKIPNDPNEGSDQCDNVAPTMS
jgi:hypothetical protein